METKDKIEALIFARRMEEKMSLARRMEEKTSRSHYVVQIESPSILFFRVTDKMPYLGRWYDSDGTQHG